MAGGEPGDGRAPGGTPGRRAVLRGALGAGTLAALGLASACTRVTPADPSTPTVPATPSGSGAGSATGSATGPATGPATGSAPSASGAGRDWEALRRRLSGRLLLPSDTGYDVARLSANPRFDDVRPAAVAVCGSAQDVVAALAFARDGGVPFSVRSGGHSYPGWSTGTGLVIDTSGLDRVQPDPAARTVRVGAGARLVDVYAAASAAGLGLPAGSCPSVAAAGLTLGGGVGVMTRLWGLTCDRVVALEQVTADGTLRTVDAVREPDLFWAARGGGGGSFGVVTSFTYRAEPAPDLSLVVLTWPWASAADVVAAWQDRAPVADRRLWTTCKLLARGGRPRVLVAGVWAGPSAGLDAALAPLLSAVGRAPASRSVGRHGFGAAMLLEAGCRGGDACHLPPTGTLVRESLAATSHVPAKPLVPQAISTLVGGVEDLARDAALRAAGLVEAGVSLDALGGAVTDVAATDTAFWHRTAPFTLQYTATWSPSSAGTAGGVVPGQPFLDAVRGLRSALLPFAGNTAYVNYADSEVVDWEQAYWGENHWRLGRIKRRYDPDGLFTFPQAVHPQSATN